ncbi:MAG TPA: hypothetical protein VFY49_20090 [Myxococcota bacterium]|nr:hypothetical protein [Myxococcota bacterium]
MRRALSALALAALLLAGCTYHVRQVGDDHFLRTPVAWEIGTTSVHDVVRDLGPPDIVRASPDGLVFVYRAQRRVTPGFVVTAYLNLFSYEAKREQDATLVATFGKDDVLKAYGVSAAPSDDLRGDMGL